MKIISKLFYLLASFIFESVFSYTYADYVPLGSDMTDIKVFRDSKVKLILQWSKSTNPHTGKGGEVFVKRKCRPNNCVITNNRNLLTNIKDFDAIVFAGDEIINWPLSKIIPKERSPHQKYVFASVNSADNYPLCSDGLDNFFNWTWTYRIDSDIDGSFIVIKDDMDKVIGPKTVMHWVHSEDMGPVNRELRKTLENKTKAAVWFVSNCKTRSGREFYVEKLQMALAIFDLTVDIYGDCGQFRCEHEDEEACLKVIRTDYYFYLAFENSFSEDYVTHTLLLALKYDAIPIVYGGANYAKFMPNGIYLNARELTPEKLAIKMFYLIKNPDKYRKYFRWKNHYSYHRRSDDPATDDYCAFCKLLNDKEKMSNMTIYENIKEWWSEPKRCSYFGEHF